MNVIFTCGGTGGHINPAIAVANMLKERRSDCNILFVGGEGGIECKLIPQAGYQLETLNPSGLTRKLTPKAIWHNLVGIQHTLGSLKKARRIIKEFQPDVIVGTGGYASFPILREGAKMGVPTCIHESNAVPGLTTRMVADQVDKILVSFEDCVKNYKHPEKVMAVGMPVKAEFIYTKRADARRELGLDDRPFVVSAFGSLGAREMNKAMAEFMTLEQQDGNPWQHLHATGSYGWRWMPDLVKEKGIRLEKGLTMQEYIYNMPTVMAAADVIISRAGASSLNEIAASGTPCIIIPSPNVADNHQEKNAAVLEQRGAAIVVHEKDCTGRVLYDTAKQLLENKTAQADMRKALIEMAVLDSTEQICDVILKLAAK